MTPSVVSTHTLPANRTMRDVYLAHIRKQFPRFEPRHDFDILALGDGRYKGSEREIYTWLDKELALQVALLGDAGKAVEGAKRALSAEGIVTGVSEVFSCPFFLL